MEVTIILVIITDSEGNLHLSSITPGSSCEVLTKFLKIRS